MIVTLSVMLAGLAQGAQELTVDHMVGEMMKRVRPHDHPKACQTNIDTYWSLYGATLKNYLKGFEDNPDPQEKFKEWEEGRAQFLGKLRDFSKTTKIDLKGGRTMTLEEILRDRVRLYKVLPTTEDHNRVEAIIEEGIRQSMTTWLDRARAMHVDLFDAQDGKIDVLLVRDMTWLKTPIFSFGKPRPYLASYHYNPYGGGFELVQDIEFTGEGVKLGYSYRAPGGSRMMSETIDLATGQIRDTSEPPREVAMPSDPLYLNFAFDGCSREDLVAVAEKALKDYSEAVEVGVKNGAKKKAD